MVEVLLVIYQEWYSLKIDISINILLNLITFKLSLNTIGIKIF
jgi:hypothetical protein